MINPSTEFLPDETLPNLRSPFSAIDDNFELNFDDEVETQSSAQTATHPAPSESEDLESFRQKTTNQAVKELVHEEPVAAPENPPVSKAVDEAMLSRTQLSQLFEQFLGQLQGDAARALAQQTARIEAPTKVTPISVSDRTEEIDQLKSLLIEAQETIIKLLTDRVDDRAKIATLEQQLKLLPGPRLTSEEQLRLVVEHDDLKKELVRTKIDLDQLERQHASFKLKQKNSSVWLKIWQFLTNDARH